MSFLSSLFGKKKRESLSDFILLSKAEKYDFIKSQQQSLSDFSVLYYWFEDTRIALEASLGHLLLRPADQLPVGTDRAYFAEHHPSLKKEQALFEERQLQEAIVFSSLDEALFAHFGGQKIIDLVKKMGHTSGEVLRHGSITSAIKSAQEKIDQKVLYEQQARSQEEWVRLNYGQHA